MTNINKILFFIFIAVVFLILIKLVNNNSVKSPSTQIKPTTGNQLKFEKQNNKGGDVEVSVKPEIMTVGEKPTFEIEFNTHSVELSFDVAKQSYLLDDQGNRFDESVWNGSPPGGHHRSGTLTFNQPLIKTKFVELVLTDIAGIKERRFRLEL